MSYDLSVRAAAEKKNPLPILPENANLFKLNDRPCRTSQGLCSSSKRPSTSALEESEN